LYYQGYKAPKAKKEEGTQTIMPFLLLFIIIPIAEVYAFIHVGGEIGVFKTLALCVITALIGGILVKIQGIGTLMKAQQNFATGTIPFNELFDGLCLVLAGALLLTPGFVTDIIGFTLLTPPFRIILRRILRKRNKFYFNMENKRYRPDTAPDDETIEGDFEHVKKEPAKLDQE